MSKNIYFLIYRTKHKRSELSLRVLGETSRDFITIRGNKASKIFKIIFSVLDAYAIKYNVSRSVGEETYELPADVGHAVLLFILTVYSAKYPDKYVSLLEKLLAGKIPLSTYLKAFIDIAIDLSDFLGRAKRRKTTLDGRITRALSPIMRNLTKILCKYGS